MNKKKLSVVMAGAMLATSVAPVLAAPVEMGLSQKKLIEKEITDLVESGKISNNEIIKGAKGDGTDTDFVSADVAKLMDDAYSVYGIKVLNEKGKEVDLHDIVSSITSTKETFKIDDIKLVLADANSKLLDGYTIQVLERENSKFLGQVIPGSQIEKTDKVADENKYTAADFKQSDFATKNNIEVGADKFVKEVEVDEAKATAKITLNAVKDMTANKEENKTIDVKLGDAKLYFKLPLDANGDLLKDSDIMNCDSFPAMVKYKKSQLTVEDPEVKAEYKLVDDSKKIEKVTYLASDLYDGLALTAKGTELQLDIENAKKVAKENGRDVSKATVKLDDTEPSLTNGVASFKVTYYASYKDVTPTGVTKEVTVKSTNEEEIKSLYKMLKDGSYEVGVVAGANRYETAVNVAKAQKISEITSGNAAKEGQNDIVLVNGESLVDGLAAAPLAASLSWNNNSNGGTAVLLSKTDSLPKETKDFLESLLVNVSSSKIRNVKIHLVGGESVLSDSLVEELKEMGFSVERHGGDNREETSLEVAEAVETLAKAKKGAFIVGGNGEADAMSIAAVAAKQKTPIIVSSVHGLTKDALKHVKNRKDNTMTIIGGESVVSAEEYAKLDELTSDTNAVKRIAGKNRFETNAAIIKEYAKSNFTEAVLVKDGQSNKGELIDALSAASFAAKYEAPIVLATDKITDAQKVELLGKKSTNMTKLTQVGQGVARTTLESVAEFLGLSNVK